MDFHTLLFQASVNRMNLADALTMTEEPSLAYKRTHAH
jgi:hypothetical protein